MCSSRTRATQATLVTDGEDLDPGDDTAGRRLRRGQVVGRYLVLEQLGAGGMGVVYRAYDPELDRPVALKVVRLEGDDSDERRVASARLVREAQTLAKVTHPNVVGVYDVGRLDDVTSTGCAPSVFVAMELVDGCDLQAWLTAEPRSIDDVVALFIEAARGLAAAHAHGIVHRDFKPANVLVQAAPPDEPDGARGRARVTDFGLARPEQTTEIVSLGNGDGPTKESPDSSGLTDRGRAVGTPAYMAPEQHAGGPVDARADQYAFCLALWEAVYGKHPFAGVAYKALASAKRHGPPPAASRGAHDARVSRRLRALLRRGLSTDPGRRYHSLQAVITELERTRRRRWPWAAAASVFVVGLSAAAYQMHAQRVVCGEDPAMHRVWNEDAHADVEASFAASGVQWADEALTAASGALDERSRQWTQMRTEACEATWLRGEQSSSMLDRRMSCLDRRVDETEAAVDLLRRADASVVRNAGQLVHGLPDIQRCADDHRLRAQVSPPDDPTTVARVDEARRELAAIWAASTAARFDEVDGALTRLERDAERIGYGPLLAEVALARGMWHDDTGSPQQAAQVLADAAKLARSVGDDRTEAESFLALTRVWGARLRDVERASFYAELAEAAIADGGNDAALSAVLYFERGTLALTEGRDAQAREALQRALAIQRELRGDMHPAYAKVLGRLAGVHFRSGEHDTAIEELRRVIDIQTRVHGRTHPRVAAPLGNLGLVLSAGGRYDEALQAMREAKDILERMFGPRHPSVAEAHDSIGHVFALAEQPDRARAHYRRSIELYHGMGEGAHPGIAVPLLGLGQLEVDIGRPDHAIEPLQEAVALLEGTAATPVQRGDTLFALARALGEVGEIERARSLAEQARGIYADPALAGDPRRAQIEAWLEDNAP